jgi:TP901 family phage tail tape measure protein
VPTVTAKLIAEISGFISPIKAATQATKDLRTELSQAATAGKLDALAGGAMKAGLALSGGFLLAESAAARFEKAMSEVGAALPHAADMMGQLSAAALQAGKDTTFSASEAAKAEAELAKAGLSASQILGGALKGSLSLAAAGSLDLGEAADVAAKSMKIFNLQGSDVGHIADVLAAGANKSATDVSELGMAMKMGGLAAKNAGLSLEDTVGTLSAFADSALVGSDGGTSLKTMLQALAAPSAEASTRMKELGINAYDAGGNFVGVARFAGILQTQLGTLTQEQRNEALATIFGADAMRAATVLFGEGESGIRDYISAVDDQGAAAEMAAKKTDNLMGDVERLTGSLETLFITSGSGANGGLRSLVQSAGNLVDVIGSLPAPVLSAGMVITGLSGAGLLAFASFVKARGAFHDAMEELRKAGPVTARFANGLSRVASVGVKAGAALTAVTVAAQIVGSFMDTELNPQVEALAAGMADLAKGGKLAGESARLFGEDTKKLDRSLVLASSSSLGFGRFIEGLISPLQAADLSATKVTERVAALDTELANMVRNGKGEQAFALLELRARATGMSMDELKRILPEYAGATEVATRGTEGLSGAAVTARLDLKALDDQARETINAAFGLETAEDHVAQAVADLTEQVKKQKEEGDKGAGSLVGQTQAARDNRASVRDLVTSYQDLVTEYGAAGKSTDNLRAQLENELVAMGFNRAEAHRYVEQLSVIPSTITTTVRLEAAAAKAAASETARELHRMLGPISVPVQMHPWVSDVKRWGGITEHAALGTLRDADVFTPRTPARYAFAEPATGGEAFIPRRGDKARSMDILDTAAGWYGAKVVPQGWYGSASTAPATTTGPAIDYMALGKAVATALRQAPLQGVVTMDGRAVGAIQGKQANILARGG